MARKLKKIIFLFTLSILTLFRITNLQTNKLFTVLEPKYKINSAVPYPDSGLLLLACKAPQMGAYFIPALGKAPKWCSFIENLTEEMEEQTRTNIYNEFRFLTTEDLEKINAKHMIGTKFVKSYMHGFIMKAKLYEKLKAEAEPFDLEAYKQEALKKRLERELSDKIYIKGRRKVKGFGRKDDLNQKYIEMIRERGKKGGRKAEKEGMEDFEQFLQDDRFGRLKTDKNFEVKEDNEEFLLRNPSLRKAIKKKR